MIDRKRSLAYWLLGYTFFIIMVGTNLPSPLYEVYRRTWHFSAAIVTLIFATYAITLIASLLIFGQLSDQLGRRKIIAPGLLMAAAGTLCFALAHSLIWLFIARALQGIAVGIVSGAITAALAELHPRMESKAAALIASLATAAGTAVGPLLAGILAQYGPWPLVLPYLVQLVLLVPAFITVWLMPETVNVQKGSNRWHLSRPTVPASIRLLFGLGSATTFLAWAVVALFMSLGPTYITLLLHLSNLAITGGALFLLFGASALTQVLLRRLPQERAMIFGVILLVVGLMGIVLAVPLHAPALLLVGTLIEGMGHGLAWMGSLALVNRIAPTEQHANVLASFYVATYLGVGIPIIGVGFLAGGIGLYPAFVAFAIVIAIAAIVLAAIIASKRQEVRQFAVQPDEASSVAAQSERKIPTRSRA